ncbi:MAG: hypothetical protein ACK5OX_06995 [Desertimonas sp.]
MAGDESAEFEDVDAHVHRQRTVGLAIEIALDLVEELSARSMAIHGDVRMEPFAECAAEFVQRAEVFVEALQIACDADPLPIRWPSGSPVTYPLTAKQVIALHRYGRPPSYEEADAGALSQYCPRCGVEPGEPCLTKAGWFAPAPCSSRRRTAHPVDHKLNDLRGSAWR